jgi:hypothetical protein
MRALTFKGFLGAYLRKLSGQRSLAVARLADLAHGQKRLVEPLLLWAVTADKTDALSKQLAERPRLLAELHQLDALAKAGRLEAALSGEDATVRPEYSKVWRSYVVRRDEHLRDDRLKLEARKRALALEATKPVSRYRMAKDLKLNPGNLFAFLKQGNPSKLSLNRAYELVD